LDMDIVHDYFLSRHSCESRSQEPSDFTGFRPLPKSFSERL
jgi:hypothetical protein